MWKSNKKDETYDVYLECALAVTGRLLTDDLAKPLRDSTEHGRTQGAMNKQRGSVILRKAIDKFITDAGQVCALCSVCAYVCHSYISS